MSLKATDIAPLAYAHADSSSVSKEDDLVYDLGNLAAFDTHPIRSFNEQKLTQQARDNVQLLINHIFDLPRVMSDMGPLAQLPPCTCILPREKRIPKPKAETKWEKFAKEKGIQKRKKGRMEFDEAKQEYMPRWGYKRANDDSTDWAIETKEGSDIYEDPWKKRKAAKIARVAKNTTANAKNKGIIRQKISPKNAPSRKIPSGISVELAETQDTKAKQRGKEGTRSALQRVQFSTASMGKFDDMRKGEMERKQVNKRKKYLPLTGAEEEEKAREMRTLEGILGDKKVRTEKVSADKSNPKKRTRSKKR